MPVPVLGVEQLHDLTAPLGLENNAITAEKLATRIEVAARGLVLAFRERPEDEDRRHKRDYETALEYPS